MMPSALLMWMSIFVGAEPAAGPKGVVAVMPLGGRGGVNQDSADLITEMVVNHVRSSGRFQRVISSTEVMQTVELDRTRQLMDCTSDSCLSEISAAMGSDQLITGNVGRLGDGWIFNLRLIDSRTGTGEHSVSRVVEGASEEQLARASDGVVRELLGLPALQASAPPQPSEAGSRSVTSRVARWGGISVLGVGGFLSVGAFLGTVGALAGAGALWLTGWRWDQAGAHYSVLLHGYQATLVVAGALGMLLPVMLLVTAAGGTAALAAGYLP